jgi:pimeloyl-ACP methyl ester carboxylesterase
LSINAVGSENHRTTEIPITGRGYANHGNIYPVPRCVGGGWGYRRVADVIRAAGHQVFTPTYTGVGERLHLATPDVDLEIYIEDIRAVIRYERLEDFVLVGHSYGGMVITGVADREYEKISRLVYLDAFLPENGQSLFDLTPPDRQRGMLDLAETRGDGWKVPRPDGSIAASVSPVDRAWIESLSPPQPLATLTQKIDIKGDHLKIAQKVYVLATGLPDTPFYKFADWARAQDDWQTIDLPIHHLMMQSLPVETARVIMAA